MYTQASIQRIMPPGAVVKDIPNALTFLPQAMRTTKNGTVVVAENALGDGAPAYCVVTGSFVTNKASGKTANFGAVLPAPGKWNGKYLQFGCGGNCGSVFESGPPTLAHSRSGYAMWHTDDGHVDRSIAEKGLSIEGDPTFAVKAPGVPAADALDDYLYRAVHSLAIFGKQATASLYGSAKVDRSYFLGCSGGGREAMVEATRYPEDFDGILAGAPYEPPTAHINFMTRQLVQLRSPATALNEVRVQLVAKAAASCDTSDGVSDGLDQIPNACEFNARAAVPLCKPGQAGSGRCLTQAQAESVSAILSAARDTTGNIVAAGWSPAMLTSSESPFYVFPSTPLTLTGPDPFGPEP
jgi:feruloyl esterase